MEKGLISAPQSIELPKGFPFYVATCAVDLPDGCLPPADGLARRLGIGRGRTPAEAASLALLEGVERYSLQYRRDMPGWFSPSVSVGGAPEPAPLEMLALGAPGGEQSVTSRGAAAGADFESAARRAVLELLEQHHCRLPGLPDVTFRRVAAAGPLEALGHWLADRWRILDVRLAQFGADYFVAVAASSDLDDGRRTEGSAAGLGLFDTLVHAAEEAVLHWRNMVALEYFGAAMATLPAADRAEVARYRGAPGRAEWPAAAAAQEAGGDVVLETSTSALMTLLATASGQRVRLFDLTHPALGVPVAKAILG